MRLATESINATLLFPGPSSKELPDDGETWVRGTRAMGALRFRKRTMAGRTVPEPRAPEQWEPDWYEPSRRERQLVERAPTSTQIYYYRLGCITRDRSVMTKAKVDWETRQNMDSQPHSDAHTHNRHRDRTYSPEPHPNPTRRNEWKGQGHTIPYGEAEGKDRGRNPFYNTRPTTEEPPRTYGEAEGEDRGWNPFYNTRPTTGEPPPTTPLKIGPLSYSAPARVKYYTHTPIQKRGGEYHSSQGVGTNSETTNYLLKLMPDRQPRESEKDYVRRLLESGITTEQLEPDIIRMRLRVKEQIRIPHSMTIADWVSCYQNLPSPGENPIDESMSASSNLVRTGMTTMLMAVNNLLDEGATSTDLAAGWRIWSDEHRYMELTLYDRRRAGEQKEKSQNNKGESPPRIYRDPREDRNNGNSQDGRYNNQQNERKYSRPPQNERGPTNNGQSGFGQNQQRGGPTTRSQTVNFREQNPRNPNPLRGAPRPTFLDRDDFMRLPKEERDRRGAESEYQNLVSEYEKWRKANNQ
ncbi:unnamed protein product [Arctogadus glacialis]